jgi:hypothetical protein
MSLQVEYKLKLGQDEFTLKAEVQDEVEFFEKMSFYSNLPKSTPNGSTDLKLAFRALKDGNKYYSIVCESEKLEFRFGLLKEKSGGGLFPKGWEPLYQKESEEAPPKIAQTAPVTPKPVTPIVNKPAASMTPVAMPRVSMPIVTPSIPAPSIPEVTQVTPNAPLATVKAAATNVLARFNINK